MTTLEERALDRQIFESILTGFRDAQQLVIWRRVPKPIRDRLITIERIARYGAERDQQTEIVP